MKKIKNNYKYYLKLINSIEKTRKRNNRNWMDLMRLAFKCNPSESKKIVRGIFKEDKKINTLIKKLVK
tara:strand:- start:3102 stop:3305 length:204 start_codon:yes stop_codon:yes gene_type:complete